MSHFKPGQSGNPRGRPKGYKIGRVKALAALDRIIGRKRNIISLENALEESFEKNPVRFFKDIIMPLLPKNATLDVKSDGIISWQSLVGPPSTEKPPATIEAEVTSEEP